MYIKIRTFFGLEETSFKNPFLILKFDSGLLSGDTDKVGTVGLLGSKCLGNDVDESANGILFEELEFLFISVISGPFFWLDNLAPPSTALTASFFGSAFILTSFFTPRLMSMVLLSSSLNL